MSINPGSKVQVQWSDGNRYPAQVAQVAPGQILVDFGNGNQQWIAEQWISEDAPAPVEQAQVGALEVAGGALQVEGGIKVYNSVEEEWNELQQLIARVEGQRMDLGGVDPADPITFWSKHFAMERAESEGTPREAAAQQQGFQDADHARMIFDYMTAKWSHIGTDEDGQQAVLQRDEFMNAALTAQQQLVHADQDAAAAADPNLLAPVAGVSVDQWAATSAAVMGLGEGATQQQLDQLLASHGVDRATWDAANAGWQAKMQGDTTFAIATKYGAAFGAAQSGGAQAGDAAAAGAGGGAAAAGGEPCTFEYYVEIMAAQACWSDQGFDVNAKLSEVFGINAGTYGGYSSYWGPKMGTDMALMQRYSELDAQYRQKYAGAGMDDDLSL